MGAFITIFILLIIWGIVSVVKDASKQTAKTVKSVKSSFVVQPDEEEKPVSIPLVEKHTVEEIIAQAQLKSEPATYYEISHLSEQEIIEVATVLNKTQLGRWFNDHHRRRFHFTDKAYAFIASKRNNQIWFTDEEFAAREAAGLRSTYMTEERYFGEQFELIFKNNELSFDEKMIAINNLLAKKSKKSRFEYKLVFFKSAYNWVKAKNLDDDMQKELKNIRNLQTRLANRMELKEEDINFRALDEFIRY